MKHIKSLDVLITTAGGWPYPQKALLTTLAGLPENARILIRDNPASKRDPTAVWLREMADAHPDRIVLYQPEWAGEHGHNMDFLVSKATAEWVLVMDSDVEFVQSDWASAIDAVVGEYPEMRLMVEIGTINSDPNDNAVLPSGVKVPRRWLPRATSYFMLVQPSWVREKGVSFGRSDFKVELIFANSFRYPLPPFLGDLSQPNRWTCENGWQLLWVGANCNENPPYTMVQIPRSVSKTYIHHGHKICGSMKALGDAPNAPTHAKHWSEDILPYIPKTKSATSAPADLA
jgi:hypothetical protein